MIVAIVSGAVLLAGAGAAPDAADDTGALREYYGANGLLNRGLYDLAASEYRAFLERHPAHERAATARYGLAVALLRLGRGEEALAEARPLAELPQFEYRAEALMVAGQCRMSLGRYGEAAESFAVVVREHPDHDMADEAAALRAEAAFESGRHAEVDASCRVLAERWPESPQRGRAEFFRGLSLAARGDDAAAAAAFEPIARSAEGDLADRATLLMARCLHRSGEAGRAEQAYRGVLDRRPDLAPEAVYGLAVLLHAGGRADESAALLDRLLADHPQAPEVPDANLLRGRISLEAGRHEEALALFAALAEDAALADDAMYWRARSALERGRNREAAAILEEAMATHTGSELRAAMTVDRAAALLRGDEAGAASAAALLEGFDERFPGSDLAPEALDLAAAAERGRGRVRESLVLCERFQSLYPGHPRALGVALLAAGNRFVLGDYEGAAAAYRAVIDSGSAAAAARLGLGLALHQQQRYEEAEQCLRPLVQGADTAPEVGPALLALGDGCFQRDDWASAERDLEAYLAAGLDQPAADEALLKLGLSRQRLARSQAARESFELLLDRFPASPHRAAAQLGQGEALQALGLEADADEALLLAAAAAPGTPVAAAAQQRLGEQALARGDGVAAADLFGAAAAAWGDRAAAGPALLRQAGALLAAQRFREALDVLADVEARGGPAGRRGEAAALRAIAMSRLASPGELPAALESITSVESAHARDLPASTRDSLAYEKAWCLRALGRLDDAAASYRHLLDGADATAPGLVAQHAAIELAELEAASGRNEEAARILRAVLDAAPADAVRGQAEYRLGAVELALGRNEGAAALLEKYLAGDPDAALEPSALLLCAEAQGRGGFYRRAVEHLERLVREFPSDEAAAAALLKLGEYRAALREWAQSEAAFEDHRRRFAESELWFQAIFGVGRAREGQERYEDAIACYREVTARHDGPTAARAQFQVGECLFAMGRLGEAAKEFLKVDILYAFPEWSAAALYEAGRSFEDSGSPVEARKQFESVVKQHPQSSWARLAEDRLRALARNPLPGRGEPAAAGSP
jgi:TolA-binding protein